MKYTFEKIHWQEFEYLAYRVLRILISKDVKFIEGGKDKGRDIIYTGSSNIFRKDLSGKWNFQVKHKSSLNLKKNQSALKYDLKEELEKTFGKNKLEFNNYILVTNLILNGNLLDELEAVFFETKLDLKFGCENFDVISYRDLENIMNENEKLKWEFPNVIGNESFQTLIENSQIKYIEQRNEGWFNLIQKQKPKFVYTSFFRRAIQKLGQYPAIILSGPPRSGKTFNAEILALNFSIHRNYQAILVEHPDDIERTYKKDFPQIFICDDVFGKHVLTFRAEEWFQKLERILSLADKSHKIIFTSREYIFRAFIKIGGDASKKFLEKIIVESHDYSEREKLALLFRYTILSPIDEYSKQLILENEALYINHKNFSPETIRTFFLDITKNTSSSVTDSLTEHLDKPDEYLKPVFFSLEDSKKAALLSVLCTDSNNEFSIYNKYKSICKDLSLKSLINAELEFDELNDSILRIFESEESKEILFYHPSMQEFLLRLLINDKTNNIKDAVLKNVNTTILDLSYLKPRKNSIISAPHQREIIMNSDDVDCLETGILRNLRNPSTNLSFIKSVFNWINIENHNLDLQLNDPALQKLLKGLTVKVIEIIFSEEFYSFHRDGDSFTWSEILQSIHSSILKYKLTIRSFHAVKLLLENKSMENFGWKISLYSLYYLGEKETFDVLPNSYFGLFKDKLQESINDLGYEVYGNDFPKFEFYKKEIKKNPLYEKMRRKPNQDWYPRFLIVNNKIKTLKKMRKFETAQKILNTVSEEYSELDKLRIYAKNRHNFIVGQGWWNE
jgi:hypothetical protein